MRILSTFIILSVLTLVSVSFKIVQQKPSDLIIGFWQLSDVKISDMPLLLPEQIAIFNKEMKMMNDSSSIEIKANGTYHEILYEKGKLHSDGNWKLSNDGEKLFLTTELRTDTILVTTLTPNKMVWAIEKDTFTYVK
jgi:hypothetical protein